MVGFSLPQRDLADQLDIIDQELQQSGPKEDDGVYDRGTSVSITPSEMQIVFDKQIGQFVSIHEHEGNVVPRDSVTYMDHNHSPALEFTTLSVSRRETQ